jgi:hypothetical protein
MGRQDNSSKAVLWIVLGIAGGLTFFGALILVVGIMAFRNLGTSPNTTYARPSAPVTRTEPPKQNAFDVGAIAPDIEGRDIDGKLFKLSDYHGKVIMLDFWGHW